MAHPEERSKAWTSPQASIRSRTYGGTEAGSLPVVIIGISMVSSKSAGVFQVQERLTRGLYVMDLVIPILWQTSLNSLQIYFSAIGMGLCRLRQQKII